MAPALNKSTSKAQKPDFWIGIGASAGGLEALRAFVRHLPENINATYIVAQHVAPLHRSLLTEIIGRETELPVREVEDGLEPSANAIYITPPNKNVVVEGNRVKLTEPDLVVGSPKPSVNTFLTSLALEKGESAVGIILSGTGSDGAKGMNEIHERGGITIAQDYMTAKYSSMPVAAVDSGSVNLVMSPEEMAAQLLRILANPRNLEALRASPVNLDNVTELTQILLEQTKVNFRHYKLPTFQRRVERRMVAVGAQSLDAYVRLVRQSADEVDALFKDLLITVTSFFRDEAEFEALRKYVKDIITQSDGEPIRVWVAGTATGEEAYTIAILFAEEIGGLAEFAKARIQIFASDLDRDAIDIARRGFYAETSLTALPSHIIQGYFKPAPMGYTVTKAIRDKIVFSIHNIAQDPPLLNLDLITCRNLMIYFQPQLQSQVFERFHYALKPRGVLFLGKSESVSITDGLFAPANSEKHIFYQRPSQNAKFGRREAFRQPNVIPPRSAAFLSTEQRELDLVKRQFASLIEAIGPNSLLVGADLKVNNAFGDVSRYVGLAAGAVDNTTMSLLREPYRQDVRAAVPSVIRTKEPYVGIVRRDQADPEQCTRLRVFPIKGVNLDEAQALVVFEEWREAKAERPKKLEGSKETNAFYEDQIRTLSDELKIAKSNLMQMVEELETSNEELQALNEELQSSNEELQSTNEELETSNEELQSTNEELSTVNEEMQVNSQQLNSVNQSLASVLNNIDAPLLVVDRGLNVTNFSRAAMEFFGISPDLTLPHITRCKFPELDVDLVGLLEMAMNSGKKAEETIDHGGVSATLSIVPHFANEVDLEGAIIMVADNTSELNEARNELQIVLDNLPASILVRDRHGKILQANHSSERVLGFPVEQLRKGHMREFCSPEVWKEINRLDVEAVRTRKPLLHHQLEFKHPDGSLRYLDTSRITYKNPKSGQDLIYAMAMDVTEKTKAQRELEVSERRLEDAIEIAGIGHWEWKIETNEVFWSTHFQKLLGIKVGTFGNKFDDFINLVHPEDKDRVLKEIEDARLGKDGLVQTYRLRHQTGKYIWLHAIGRMDFDNEHNLIGISGTIQDITASKNAEFEIRERNHQLQLASEMASLGYWKIDLETQAIFWSSQMYKIHGVDEKRFRLTRSSARAFVHPDDAERIEAVFEDVSTNGGELKTETRIVRPDGEVRYLAMTGRVELDANEKPVQLYGAMFDVTEDRKSRAALITSERRLDMAVTASGLGFWEWNIATNEEYWSERYREILGIQEKDFQPSQAEFQKRLHPDDRKRVLAENESHLKDRTPYSTEFRMRHKDGHFVWVSDMAQAEWDENGKPFRMNGSIEDITERKERDLNLRTLNEQFRLAAKLSSVGYWRIDLIAGTLFWSEEIFNIHGVTPETYKPELDSAIKFYHSDDVDYVNTVVQAAIEKAEPFEFEARIVRPNGDIRTVSANCSVNVNEKSEVVNVFGVFNDVTEDRTREAELKDLLAELSRSNEELNRFSHVCSHDMKEPVRLIENMSEMLLDPEIQADVAQREEILKRINVNMTRLRGIIDSLLAYSRLEAKVEVTDVNLNKVVREVLEYLDLNIREQDAKVTHGKMPTLRGSPVHFVQLLQNLTENALKHSDVEKAKIKISSRTLKNEVRLFVEDNGRGIPEDSRDRVFELFRRLKRRDETEGTGLGLSICKKIVTQYGGTITCRDSKLGGALFEVSFPINIMV